MFMVYSARTQVANISCNGARTQVANIYFNGARTQVANILLMVYSVGTRVADISCLWCTVLEHKWQTYLRNGVGCGNT